MQFTALNLLFLAVQVNAMGQRAHPQYIGKPMVIIGDRGLLSKREAEVLQLEAEDYRDIEKASVQGTKPSTIITQMESVKSKLGVWGRGAAVCEGFRLGILIVVDFDKRVGKGIARCFWPMAMAAVFIALLMTVLSGQVRPSRTARTGRRNDFINLEVA